MSNAVIKTFILLLCFGLLGVSVPANAGRIENIRARGYFGCGLGPDVAGFSVKQDQNNAGFDADVCRAVAVAILGADAKVVFKAAENVRQLSDNDDIDMVTRRLTWSLSRATTHGMMFGPITFYDGQGFLLPRDGAMSAAQLMGEKICVNAGPHAKTLIDHFRGAVRTVIVATDADAEKALHDGRCTAFSADVSWLAAARAGFKDGFARFAILPDIISKEPLAPLVRQGDDRFYEVVRWTVIALIEAEERNVTSRNAAEFGDSHGAVLGLDARWIEAVIAAVGNYGEMFERNLGQSSPIKLDRGLNKLWRDGGLMFAPPVR